MTDQPVLDSDQPAAPARLVQPAPRLHEINWQARRWWSFIVTIVGLALIAGLTWIIGQPQTPPEAAQAAAGAIYALCGLIAFVGVLYIAGATGYEIAQLFQAARVDAASLVNRRAAP